MIATLKQVFESIHELHWGHALYLRQDDRWRAESPCSVLDPNDVADDADEAPQEAVELGLNYALGIACVQDVLENTESQRVKPTLENFLLALEFYYQNDAFMEFSPTANIGG